MNASNSIIAYHVVTDRPMQLGQQIIFDDAHHNGVYQRVHERAELVNDIYTNPAKYNSETLDYPTTVALRELALEEVRQKEYPTYPSRMGCLYVSKTFEEADNWGKYFAEIGRPTYSIVKLDIKGNFDFYYGIYIPSNCFALSSSMVSSLFKIIADIIFPVTATDCPAISPPPSLTSLPTPTVTGNCLPHHKPHLRY